MSTQPSDALVFFGATGDLAYKQIFPALQALIARGELDVPIVGIARSGWSIEQLRARARDSIEHHGHFDRASFDKLSSLLRYVEGDYADPVTFDSLRRTLGNARRPLHYLAIPPSTFNMVIDSLARSGCAGESRVAVEKPFGHDLASAVKLNETLLKVFPESSIFRIDHFLGKEPVLNLMYFRFANWSIASLLDREHVDNVQITMAEPFGVQGRGKFYDETGAIRDVLQNHLLQVLAILTMDPPVGDDHECVRDEKVRILKAVRPLDAKHVVRGQFRGYRDEPGVASSSNVETFVAVGLHIETWPWAGVPFFIRAGKCLPMNAIEVRVQFKKPPREIYPVDHPATQYLRVRIGPDITAIALGMQVKSPGERMVGQPVELLASEDQTCDILPYERLLGDALRGDAGLFARADEIDAQWGIVDPVLSQEPPPYPYEPGSWGPKEADRLVAGIPGGWCEPIEPATKAPIGPTATTAPRRAA